MSPEPISFDQYEAQQETNHDEYDPISDGNEPESLAEQAIERWVVHGD